MEDGGGREAVSGVSCDSCYKGRPQPGALLLLQASLSNYSTSLIQSIYLEKLYTHFIYIQNFPLFVGKLTFIHIFYPQ